MIPPTLLLTRPVASAQAFQALLDPGAVSKVKVVISPLLEIVATGRVPQIGPTQGVIFTSANGVLNAPVGAGRTAFCVGVQTTEQARKRGWHAATVGETAQELIQALTSQPPDTPLLHLAGVHTRGDIAQTLSARGITTTHHALYDQVLVPLSDVARAALRGPCIIPVFSPRSAEHLVNQAAGQLGQAHLLALSSTVAVPFRGESIANLFILPAPRTIYMCKEVEKLCLALSLP